MRQTRRIGGYHSPLPNNLDAGIISRSAKSIQTQHDVCGVLGGGSRILRSVERRDAIATEPLMSDVLGWSWQHAAVEDNGEKSSGGSCAFPLCSLRGDASVQRCPNGVRAPGQIGRASSSLTMIWFRR